MTELYDAAAEGDMERVTLLIQQGVNKNQTGGDDLDTALSAAAKYNKINVVRYLVEQGADMEKANIFGDTPLIYASAAGHVDVARYLLEQGANRDKSATSDGYTSLHCAAEQGRLETAKLLMVYGADLNVRNNRGELPIDMTDDEEIKQAIRDEPRRRMDEAPGKRATEQDRHPNAAASASTQQTVKDKEDDEEENSNKKPRLDGGAEEVEGNVAEEDEDSEPNDEEDDD